MFFLLALSCAFILYAGLYPFTFSFGLHEESIRTLLTLSLNDRISRGDVIANVLLFLPFGFFAMNCVFLRVPRLIRMIFVIAIGVAFSFGIECTQTYIPGRSASAYDLAANTAGTLFGALFGLKNWRRKPSRLNPDIGQSTLFPILLLGVWLGSRLFPYVPTLDIQNIKNGLKPLFFGEFSPLNALGYFIVTMVVCRLIQTIALPKNARTALMFLPLAVIVVEPFIVGGRISQAQIFGTLPGIAAWWCISGWKRLNTGILAFMLMIHIVLQGWSPFVFSSPPGSFSIIPFVGFMKSSIQYVALQFVEKVFLYGALVWLPVAAGRSLKFSLILSVTLLTGIELAQRFIAGRVPEITDPVMAVILGVFLYFLDLRKEKCER